MQNQIFVKLLLERANYESSLQVLFFRSKDKSRVSFISFFPIHDRCARNISRISNQTQRDF